MPQQAALLPELVTLPDQPARWCVMGLLHEDARVLVMPSGHVSLQVLITQRLERHPDAVPVLAVRQFPAGNSAAAQISAHHQADRMRQGTEVLAVGSCLRPGSHRGARVLVLDEVVCITLHEPTRAAA